ncbi:PREDICTED: thyrotropin-releasing hormone-degrading ectoenzyme-like [Priapulus caudatus]|uniref:Thyrotropin-releasing hormone-degrading ectoenzyme-like n=1 Tax=Priapulus caudatus TaxID=37621 RepID=A0ABM1E6F5_PRICU|nr:PREDICTED: thyrotropin-releasing hormone-degrading ectoenzyme-like [Priapulus caudatus]
MDTWTAQMNYPLVTIERNYGANPTARISQKRFLLDPDSLDEEIDDNPYNYVWQIPYTYISRQTRGRVGVRTLHWLRNETGVVSETVPVDKDWLLADVAGYAYYRVNYDERNWNLLVEQLKSHHDVFSVLDRYKMIDDAFSLARAGELDTVLALQLSEYLVDETGLPWHSALRHLDYLRLMLRRTPTYTFLETT